MTRCRCRLPAIWSLPSVTPTTPARSAFSENILKSVGFEVHRVNFSEPGTADVRQSLRPHRRPTPHIHFRGIRRVPPGDETPGPHGAFSARSGGLFYVRGAVRL